MCQLQVVINSFISIIGSDKLKHQSALKTNRIWKNFYYKFLFLWYYLPICLYFYVDLKFECFTLICDLQYNFCFLLSGPEGPRSRNHIFPAWGLKIHSPFQYFAAAPQLHPKFRFINSNKLFCKKCICPSIILFISHFTVQRHFLAVTIFLMLCIKNWRARIFVWRAIVSFFLRTFDAFLSGAHFSRKQKDRAKDWAIKGPMSNKKTKKANLRIRLTKLLKVLGYWLILINHRAT